MIGKLRGLKFFRAPSEHRKRVARQCLRLLRAGVCAVLTAIALIGLLAPIASEFELALFGLAAGYIVAAAFAEAEHKRMEDI